MNYQIKGLTIAVTEMSKMLGFYGQVFDLKFTELEMFGSKLYSAQWASLELLFCPAAIAQNTAKQNRQQFDILVDDLDFIVKTAMTHGGKMMSDIQEDANGRSVGIYDPDGNSIVFKQKSQNR